MFTAVGGRAVDAPLPVMGSVAADSAGNIYTLGPGGLLRISQDGLLNVVTLADGTPVSAQAFGITIDAQGNFYLPLASSSRPPFSGVYKIDRAGRLTLIPAPGPITGSIAVDRAGNLYVPLSNQVHLVTPNGTDSTVAVCDSCSLRGLALDSAGNLYAADDQNNVVRKVLPGGSTLIIAGNGQAGYSGDGGPAIQARLNSPERLAADASGNLLIADTGNNAIRRVGTDGTIQTIAGTGRSAFGGDGGPAVRASLRSPYDIAVDQAGAVYIADSGNWRLRAIKNGIITTIAGNGAYGIAGDNAPAVQASLYRPAGVAVDRNNGFYYSDNSPGSPRVRYVNSAGIITTVVGGVPGFGGDGGPAIQARLSGPHGLALDAAGNLYIADSENGRVRRVGTDGIISTVAGGGDDTPQAAGDGIPATSAYLINPTGVAVDAGGNLYIAETGTVDRRPSRVRKVNTSGIITTIANNLGFPSAITIDTAGNVFVNNLDQVVRIAPDGSVTTVFTAPRDPSSISRGEVHGLAIDASGNLYISTILPPADAVVMRLDPSGKVTVVAGGGVIPVEGVASTAVSLGFYFDKPLAIDNDGRLLIADNVSPIPRIWRVTMCDVSVDLASVSIAAGAGTGGFILSAASDCAWAVHSRESWLAIITNVTGAGTTSVFFSALENKTQNARSGVLQVGGQQVVVTQQAPGSPVGSFEPVLTRHLQPGFYIAEVTTTPRAAGGFWGMEVAPSLGRLDGGLNVGGGISPGPGFSSFSIDTTQTVTIQVSGFYTFNANVAVYLMNSSRQVIANANGTTLPVRLSRELQPGYYIVQVSPFGPLTDFPEEFFLSIGADHFAGPAFGGGYLGPNMIGFGAFYLAQEQDVIVRLLGRGTYGTAGAENVTLTLRDANRNVVTRISPP